jgi:proteasome beta subunit
VTVVLAVKCIDGVAIASDSQITQSDRGMSFPAQKLNHLGDQAAWGGSGARSVLMDLDKEFNSSPAAILESEDVGRALQERALPIMRHHYENFIEHVPGEKTEGTPSAYVLAAGYAGEEPFIIEINPNGMVSHYEDIGFHAVGSGSPMAHQAGSLLAHFRMMDRKVEYGVVALVRVIEALTETQPSVGGPIDVARIRPEGAEHLDEAEIAEVQEQVKRWRDLEQKALDKLFG